jgi:hypothetical protein
MTPEVTVAGLDGVSEIAANLTPSVYATLVQVPPGTPEPVSMGSSAPAAGLIPDIALAYFLGGAMVILVLAVYEIYLWKKTKK